LASPGMAAAVAWWAHIGGFVFGALVAFLARHALAAPAARLRLWRPRRPRPWSGGMPTGGGCRM
jgi:membrane associated rhomboid family serine protease